MSARRPPSTPPELPGFTYEALLGSGGFADVFLYQQLMPQRRVAVKVLLTERMTRGSADAFDAEANIMAAKLNKEYAPIGGEAEFCK